MLLLITSFHGCVIHMYVLLQQPAIRAPPVPFQHRFCQGRRGSASVHGCAALPAHIPASSRLLLLHIPILLCSECSQLGKAVLLCFSWNVFTNHHCLSQRWPGCSFQYCRPCSLTACFSPQRMPLGNQLTCWNRQVFQALVRAVLPVRAVSELAVPYELRWTFLSK